MKDRTAKDIVTLVGEHLAYVERHHVHARANFAAWSGLGYPTGGGQSRTPGIGDPTGGAALAADRADAGDENGDHPAGVTAPDQWEPGDHFDLEQRRMDLAFADLARATRNLYEIVKGAVDPELARNLPPVEGCALCAEITTHDGRPHPEGHSEVYNRITRPSMPHGRKIPVCSWCDRFIRDYGTEPHRDIVAWRLDHPGSNVPHTMIRDHHPTEFDRTQHARRTARRTRQPGKPSMGNDFEYGGHTS